MSICALCLKDKELAESHVIPSFIIKWLKDTSVTGYVRDARHGNKRIQDGYKPRLLCYDCEQIISGYETKFSDNIFRPFTKDYLELNGKIKKDGYLQYGEWLNKFIISIVWRSFKSNFYTNYPMGMRTNWVEGIIALLERWRRYLLEENNYCGNITNYVLFLRNIYEGTGELPEDISPQIVHYLMRTIDGALIMDEKTIIDMNKLGPIMTLTALYPNKITGYPNSIIAKTGKLKIEQVWSNAVLNRYLFVDRPNELDKLRVKTPKQYEQVDRAFNKNLSKINTTMTINVINADKEKRA